MKFGSGIYEGIGGTKGNIRQREGMEFRMRNFVFARLYEEFCLRVLWNTVMNEILHKKCFFRNF